MMLLLAAVIGLALCGAGRGGVWPTETDSAQSAACVCSHGADSPGTLQSPQRHLPKNGLTGDVQSGNRVSTSRVQRVQPPHGKTHVRTHGRGLPGSGPGHIQSHRFCYGGRLETAPFQRSASRMYYIIALRRLII